MGYKDSMNLYQAFNMNGWGFVDPWGDEYFVFNGDNVTIYPERFAYETALDFRKLNKELGGNVEVINKILTSLKLYEGSIDNAPDKYRNMIMEKKLQDLSKTSFKKIEFLDRLSGESEGYNSTAHVYNSRGNGEIEYDTFDARTYPGKYKNGKNYDWRNKKATIKNGTYLGERCVHGTTKPKKYQYDAIKITTLKGFEWIPTVGINPYAPEQIYPLNIHQRPNESMAEFSIRWFNSLRWYAKYIQIHKFSISWGCLMINKKQWDYFWRIVDLGDKEKIKIIVKTSKNK
jgi:hypothetical protein